MSKRTAFLIPLAFLFTAIALRVVNPPWLEDLRIKVYTSFQRVQPREYTQTPVIIVDLDEESLERYGQWPWPRTYVAKLVERLGELGASAVVFDMVFAEKDRTSPDQIIKELPQSSEWGVVRDMLSTLPEHDRVLARSFARVPVVTGFALNHEPPGTAPLRKAGFAFSGDNPMQFLPSFSGAVGALPVLQEAAAGNGHFNLLTERDGVIRRVPMLLSHAGEIYPALAAEAMRVAQGATAYKIKSSGGSGEKSYGVHTGISQIRIGGITVPTDAMGRVWLYDSGYQEARWLPAWQVIENELPAGAVHEKIVLIGTSAAGLKDLRATPLNPSTGGVEVHAQLLEQMITGDFLKRPDWADGAEVIFLVIFCLLLILLLPRVGALWCALFAALGILAAWIIAWYAYSSGRWLFDPTAPSIAGLMIYFSASLSNFIRVESERRQIRDAFSRYLSPSLVSQLAAHPEKLKLGGETRTMTLLFTDIRGFTTISEQLSAHEVTSFINRFMTPMTDIVLQSRGTIDKYMGDGLMAFWNAPLDVPDHARLACLAALEMRHQLDRMNEELRREHKGLEKDYAPLRIGIGVNTGDCCVGNLGSSQRFDYSVVGDPVNLASRLEGQSKSYGVDIVIGEDTFEQASDYAALELDLVRVKGKTRPVRIFALLGDSEYSQFDAFIELRHLQEEMLYAYRSKHWVEANRLAKACSRTEIGGALLQSLYAMYALRIQAYLSSPPPEDWDGVFVASTK